MLELACARRSISTTSSWDSASSPTKRLDAEAVKAAARALDPQVFHSDEDAAKDAFFTGLAASGWHTTAPTLSWPGPTRPGDILHVESEVLAVMPSRSRHDRGFVTPKSETKNQEGAVVQVRPAKLLVWKRPL